MATDKEISLKNLYIQSLSFDISEKEKDILNRRAVLLASIQRINELDKITFAETVLNNNGISEMWREVENIASIQESVRKNISAILETKINLVGAYPKQWWRL